jgi:hypothetical protein
MDAIAEDAAVESYRAPQRSRAPWLCVDHRLLAERVERSNLGNPLDVPLSGSARGT